jgi:hypothetical protein
MAQAEEKISVSVRVRPQNKREAGSNEVTFCRSPGVSRRRVPMSSPLQAWLVEENTLRSAKSTGTAFNFGACD